MSDQTLWYATRAAGAVSLVMLTAVVVVGLLARLRFESSGWPRFLSASFHSNLALMSIVFLAIHIVTAVVDPFTSLGITPVVVPFGSSYRRLWLGLGTLAFELIVAIAVTSLVRSWIGARLWRTIHWLSYASWPIAVAHGLGTGTDARAPWMMGITVVCIAAVVVVGTWRLVASPADPLGAARREAAISHRAVRG